MAISNAIGSNVFDILICLGVPWLFKTIDGDYITVKSKGNFENKINNSMVNFRVNILIFISFWNKKGLTYSTITLFGTVVILLVSLHINKWQLDKKLGCFLMVIYVLFIALASFYESDVLGASHLPMCSDSKW